MSEPSTAMITGASAGIGATYADRLARRGHNIILVARNERRLTSLAEQLRRDTGRMVEILPADLTSKDALLRVEQRLREDSSIGVLVNNAGIASAGPMLAISPERLQEMVDLNVTAPMRLTRAAIEGFVPKRRGTLINIASVLALAPERFNGTYSATKAFVLNLSLSLHSELQGSGVRVQAVLPGATRTELWGKAGVDVDTLPADMVMDVDHVVDAALAGLDQGEVVTIPSLPDVADWRRYEEARIALGPNLSRQHPASRYATERALPWAPQVQ